jgi:PAS domain S-box-containing protein/putative nucleotidyltransferase with HDIG domain
MQFQAQGDELRHIEQALDALNCGAALVDRDGNLVFANARLCALMDRKREDVIGRNVRGLYSRPEDREFLELALAKADEARDFEFVLPKPDGTRLPVVVSARPLPAPLDHLHVVTIIAISAQKQALASLREDVRLLTQVGDNALEHAIELRDYSEALEKKVRERTEDLRLANLDAIYMLAVASEAKDADTGRHVRRIQWFAEQLARKIGLSDSEAHDIGYAAMLHDIGKIHVPDEILKKPGPLDDNERFIMRQHTLFGERILSKRPFFNRARKIARSHHENWDGSGYPDGTSRDQIPLDARIVHVVDVYDALTQPRVYKKAWTTKDANEFICTSADKYFEPEICRAFKALVDEGEIERITRMVEPLEDL